MVLNERTNMKKERGNSRKQNSRISQSNPEITKIHRRNAMNQNKLVTITVPADEYKAFLEYKANLDKGKRQEENATTLLAHLRIQYGTIEYGDFWKSEITYRAVEKLERELDFQGVSTAICSTVDVKERWRLAIEFTEFADGAIAEASECADKLVNGSSGEWCPDTTSIIEKMWQQILLDLPDDASLIEGAIRCSTNFGEVYANINIPNLITEAVKN